jgi:hypothetical protein
MLAPIDLNKVPAYLRAVTICKPKGNIAADVAYEVSRMGREIRRAHGDGRASGMGGVALEPVTKGVVAAVGLGALTTLISVLTNELLVQLVPFLPQYLRFVFHGAVLALPVWLAAMLFGIREPLAFAVLAAGCIAAYLFELSALSATGAMAVPLVSAGKSMIFALFAAMALPCFRTVPSWASLAVVGLVAGQLAISFGAPPLHLDIFVWEALLVATAAFFLALNEPDVARAV